MSFQAVIESLESRQIWCKVINSLVMVSDNLKFVITDKFLSVSALNNSKTANLDAYFKNAFFDKYQFLDESVNMEDLVTEGFTRYGQGNEQDNDNQRKSCYSFIIQARFLSVLFKSAADDNEYTLSINFHKDCPASHRFRLLVEKMSNKKVRKQFSPGFRPCWLDNRDISKRYKQRLDKLWASYSYDEEEEQEFSLTNGASRGPGVDESTKSICYLLLENAIIKRFLEVTPNSIEDFQINIKKSANRLHFLAFLKPIKKDKVYIRQPMSLCVSVSLDDITDQYLYQGAFDNVEESDVVRVTFRLKELKTFINMSTNVAVGNFNPNNEDGTAYNYSSNGLFEIFFAKNGDPIVFESSLKKGLVKMKLTQITDVDESLHVERPIDISAPTEKAHLPEYKVIRTMPKKKVVDNEEKQVAELLEQQEAENLFVDIEEVRNLYEESHNTISPRKKRAERLSGKLALTTTDINEEFEYPQETHKEQDNDYEHQATITWNSRAEHHVDYANIHEGDLVKRKRMLVDDENANDGIGRTQNVKKMKGLFD